VVGGVEGEWNTAEQGAAAMDGGGVGVEVIADMMPVAAGCERQPRAGESRRRPVAAFVCAGRLALFCAAAGSGERRGERALGAGR
jgi:hypothetical protein